MPQPPDSLVSLLVVQERDDRVRKLVAQLALIPADRARVEKDIAAERGAIDAARVEVRELETKKKLLETEIGSAEAKLAKYRTQQLSVKKNEEYQALGKEIATTQDVIGALEEQELGIMFSLDEAKARFATAEASLRANITDHERRLATLVDRESNLRAEQDEALAALAAARAEERVPARVLAVYDRVAARNFPACVGLRGGKCAGCHLRVSSEAEAGSRGKDPTVIATCDQCGRILWFESA
jgi:uncharacterized protein